MRDIPEKLMWTFAILIVIAEVAFFLVCVYVAWHFVSKYW